MAKRERSWTDDDLRLAVQESRSKLQVLNALNLRPTGGNYATLDKYLEELKIDISHFTGQGWNTGDDFVAPSKKDLDEILVDDSTYTNSATLRLRLIDEGVLEARCVSCELDEWLGKPIPLELDHINGKHTDNRLENLRLLCPSCHALTRTYKGFNIKARGNKAIKTHNTGKKSAKLNKPRRVFKIHGQE